RFSDFHTITRAHTLSAPTQIDAEIFGEVRDLFRSNWKEGQLIRLLGVHVSSFVNEPGQQLLNENERERWRRTLAAADKLREKHGETTVTMASSLRGRFRERTHENPAGLPGRQREKS